MRDLEHPLAPPPCQTRTAPRPELLAPAGDAAALAAALEAGADAVYLGLTTLNARRHARNFRPDELAAAVEQVHAAGARVYLTLNTDIAEREIGQAARILELARHCRVDAVLVRDPALLLLRPHFREVEFHLSTQGCIANQEDVAAARELGADRVVLARELTLAEVEAASAVPGIRTEVFAQGALCYCVSGRCLLSSWGGGRSGNRGTCTSPCRVPWRVDAAPAGSPFSMRDLSVLGRLGEVRRTGVAALKIEGRMKTAAWVGDVVRIYRRALDGEPVATLVPEIQRLGAYTGRLMTDGYLDGNRLHLTGPAGRGTAAPAPTEPGSDVAAAPPAAYDLELHVGATGIRCRCMSGTGVAEWSQPCAQVRTSRGAVTCAEFLRHLGERPLQDCRLRTGTCNEPETLLPARSANHIEDRISRFLHQVRRRPPTTVRVELPPPVKDLLQKTAPGAENRRQLGDAPDRVRLAVAQLPDVLSHLPGLELIVDGATAEDLPRMLAAIRADRLLIALPPVFFDSDLERVRSLLNVCARHRLPVEVNNWGGWRLARSAGVRMEGGPGLPVLNSLAARALASLGLVAVTLSQEADREQLQDLTQVCPVPCSLVVYGRPPLLLTRVRVPQRWLGHVFEDRRGIRLVPQTEGGLTCFRPHNAFSLRDCHNPQIRARHLVVDLVGAPDPVAEWQRLGTRQADAFHFNYDRALS